MCISKTVPDLQEKEWQEKQPENVSESAMDALPIEGKEKKQTALRTSY